MDKIMAFVLTHYAHYGYYFVHFEYRSSGVGAFRYLILVGVPVAMILRTRNRRLSQPHDCSQTMSEDKYNFETQALDCCMFLSVTGSILSFLSYVSTSTLYRIAYSGIIAAPLLIAAACRSSRGVERFCYGSSLVLALLFFWWYDFIYLGSGQTVPYVSCLE